jgi:hypothetical protein
MNVALVSCASLPDWEVDDLHLVAALARRGAVVERPAWSADVDWGRYAGALLRTPWDYSDQLDRFLAWADRAAAATSLWHGGPVLRWNLRKTYLAELEADGVPLAPTAWLAAGDSCDVAALCAARGWTAGLIKPVVGASARETLRFRPGELAAAQAHVDRLLPSEGLMVQPYLEAVEREGELSVILIDGVATHGVRKVPVPGDFRVQDDYGAHDEPYPVDGELGALAAQTVRAAEARLGTRLLYARVDALRLGTGELVLNELEIVEPSLFFRHGAHAADALAEAFLARLEVR